MTIKTQGGKVITKAGKVSCTCCEEEHCCPYLAQHLFTGLFTWDDLPDELEFRENLGFGEIVKNLVKVNPYPSGEGGMVYYAGPTEEDYIYLLNPGETTIDTCPAYRAANAGTIADWNGGPGLSGGFNYSCCLINSYSKTGNYSGIFDKFADTYTVDWNILDNLGTSTAVRQSLCIWTFTALGNEYLLSYESADYFRWQIKAQIWSLFKNEDYPSFENTPTGNYFRGGFLQFIVA